MRNETGMNEEEMKTEIFYHSVSQDSWQLGSTERAPVDEISECFFQQCILQSRLARVITE